MIHAMPVLSRFSLGFYVFRDTLWRCNDDPEKDIRKWNSYDYVTHTLNYEEAFHSRTRVVGRTEKKEKSISE